MPALADGRLTTLVTQLMPPRAQEWIVQSSTITKTLA